MTPLAAMHVAKAQLGLDEPTYRSVCLRVTGKESSKAMSVAEQGKVLDEFRRLGFKPAAKALEGPFARKLQALWIAGWNLGLIRNRRDEAMLDFVKDMTGVDNTRFLIDAAQANKAIEGLKAWLTREAKVVWSDPASRLAEHSWMGQPGAKVALAQWVKIHGSLDPCAFKAWVEDHAYNPIGRMTKKEWQGVQNRLGEDVRRLR